MANKGRITRSVGAYWWTRLPNFGDALAPFLLKRFADIENIQLSSIEAARIVSIGSVLEHVPKGWTGYIVGSGLLRETSKLKFDASLAKVLAVRGPLTARSFTGNFGIGDPGLLASELINFQEKQWDLGIVPHWQDDELADRFLALIPKQFTCRVIYPSGDPLTVIREIAACRRVVTSSLHGMITADAIGGIPRRIEICDKMSADGGLFKFHDYSASIHLPLEVGKMQEPNWNRVEDARFEIYDAYRELSEVHAKA